MAKNIKRDVDRLFLILTMNKNFQIYFANALKKMFFFVGVTTQDLVITIEIVTPTKKIVVLTNKIAEAYFTNRSSWFY